MKTKVEERHRVRALRRQGVSFWRLRAWQEELVKHLGISAQLSRGRSN
jgi:hypothetical protein